MEISGTYTFNASPERVWNLLMDPAVLSSCIPGCEKLESTGDDAYTVTLHVGIAAITGTYTGVVRLADQVPPASYRLIVEGQGKPGFVKGSSAVSLRPDGDATEVSVSGSVQTGGIIARLGQRLVGGVAKMMMDRFFECLMTRMNSDARERF